ncbi:hypothetical protein F5146DRAFT_1000262 [Armillaria mellea]|nr:hypothetical protein F5146DRAFT_1000262 [Armillaria mellea]
MAALYSELYDLIIDYLADNTSTLTACCLVSRAFLPRCQHHLFRHVTFYPDNTRCARFFADKAPLVEELTIFERRLPGNKGMRTDAWTEALPRVLPLLVSLRRVRISGQMYLDARHRVRSGVQGILAQLTSLTLDGVFFSSLAEVTGFFGCVPRLKKLAMNVVTVGRGDDDERDTLGHAMQRAGDAQSRDWRWIAGCRVCHELFGRAPMLETAMLLDWRGSHHNLDLFVPLAYTDRYEVRRTTVPKTAKVDTADAARSVLDWTRRMLDTGTQLEEVVVIVNHSSVVDDEGVRAA